MAIQKIERHITLDVYDHDTTPETFKAIACDNDSRYVVAEIQNEGVWFDIGSGSTVELTVIRPDGIGVSITGEPYPIEYTSGGEVDPDTGEQAPIVTGTYYGVYAELDQPALAISGTLLGQFKITSGTQILRTEIFKIKNGRALDAETDEWAGECQGHNLDEMAADIAAVESDVDQIKEDLTDLEEVVDTLNDGGLNLKDDVIEAEIQDWLEEHPEATTTIQDGSVTEAKLSTVLASKINDVPTINVASMVNGNLTSANIESAILTALTKSSRVYIPRGEYSFNVDIVTDCTMILDSRCYISPATTSPVIHAYNCMFNLIGGNIRNGVNDDSRNALANENGLIFLEGCHDSSIVGVKSPYSKANGVIWIKDCTNFTLEQSTFSNMLRAAMFICGHCVNVAVRNCKFTNSVPLSGQDYCYFVYTGSTLLTDYFEPVDGLIYENNYCSGSEDCGLDTHGARNVIIRNNIVLDTVCAITAYNDNNRVQRPSGWKMENILIENNYCDSTKQIPSSSKYPHPFLFIGASNFETALYDEFRNCIVRNNTFKTANNFSPNLSLGAIFTDYVSRNVIFEGNTFRFYEGADARITFRRSFGSVFRNNMVEDGTATVFFNQSLCEISGNVGFTYNWSKDSISYVKGLNNVFPEINSPTYRTGDLFWSNGLKMCTSYGICNRYQNYADAIKTFSVTVADGVATVANNVYIPHLALTLSEVGTAYIVDVIDATRFTLIHFVNEQKVPIPDGTYTATIRDVTMISMA